MFCGIRRGFSAILYMIAPNKTFDREQFLFTEWHHNTQCSHCFLWTKQLPSETHNVQCRKHFHEPLADIILQNRRIHSVRDLREGGGLIRIVYLILMNEMTHEQITVLSRG